jgi:cysteine desulfurase/selenocysteine lyase
VAQTWGAQNLEPGDEILVTELAHHANIVPWQLICERTGARLVVAPINDRGEVEELAFAAKLSSKTKLVSFAHISNSLGTVLPVARFTKLAHDAGALVLVDGSQGVVHGPVNVAKLDVDFYVFSGHKLYAPSGTGVLYGKEALLEAMPPWQGGGDMIDEVRFEQTSYNDLPFKFEAGTPNIAGFAGLGAAIRYLENLGWDSITNHENALLAYGTKALEQVEGLRIIGNAAHKSGVLSFVLEGIHPTDAGTLLDAEGIAIRTGHHCAQPVMQHYGVPGTARASLALYNTISEIDALVRGLAKVRKIFG